MARCANLQPPPPPTLSHLVPLHQKQRAAVCLCKDGHVLQDLVTQRPDVQLVEDVLYQHEDKLPLVQPTQLWPGLSANLRNTGVGLGWGWVGVVLGYFILG